MEEIWQYIPIDRKYCLGNTPTISTVIEVNFRNDLFEMDQHSIAQGRRVHFIFDPNTHNFRLL